MTIAIDIDEVLADTITVFLKYHNDTYGTSFGYPDMLSNDWRISLNLNTSELTERITAFDSAGHIHTVPPVSGAVEAVKRLASKHKLIALTSRWGMAVQATKPWIENNFSNLISEVHFSSNPFVTSDLHLGKKDKGQICKDLSVKLIIEDSVSFAKQCSDAGVPVILLDRPWNKEVSGPKISRAYEWGEVPQMVSTILE